MYLTLRVYIKGNAEYCSLTTKPAPTVLICNIVPRTDILHNNHVVTLPSENTKFLYTLTTILRIIVICRASKP